jgi:hypothetical protein
MDVLQSLSNHLLASLQGELAVQRRLLELVVAQREAVLERRPEAVEAATARLRAELERATARRTARSQAVGRLARHWGVSAAALTLASIAERLGARGAALRELRVELRGVGLELEREGRRLAMLLRYQRAFVQEVLQTLLGDEHDNPVHDGGTLVDTSA